MTTPYTPSGYSIVQAGHIVSVVTCLEMCSKPQTRIIEFPDHVELVFVATPDLDAYRDLYRKIGANWLWFSRLVMSDEELGAALNDKDVHVHVLRKNQEDIGLLELDFRQKGQCEIVFLGLTTDATGQGLGRALMNKAIAFAWSQNIERLWLHTCSLDHPNALAFYIRSGFSPYAFQVESQPDPRLTGHLPTDSAPHVPLIRPSPWA